MVIYFLKIESRLDQMKIYEKLRSKVGKVYGNWLEGGYIGTNKIIGDINEESNYFSIFVNIKHYNSFQSRFYGDCTNENNKCILKGYFYINPIFIILYVLFLILTYASLTNGITLHSLSMLIGMIAILIFAIYRNLKDIKLIKEFLKDIAENNIFINQTNKIMCWIFVECCLMALIIFIIIKD